MEEEGQVFGEERDRIQRRAERIVKQCIRVLLLIRILKQGELIFPVKFGHIIMM